ncbi:lipoate--protein ligase [Brachyspira aalborgi]|uniref:lipoate--protein ligase n=2 Tax=Brachyspira aalborgi TaxID=29522 RepID=A0A5C8D999_9SPIR|nr:lipoate--protein ligase [Brachyspira aalborgi]
MEVIEMIYFYNIDSIDPYYNLAFEEYILKNYLKDSYFLLWQNANTIVVGLHQNTIEEINREFADKNKINIVRRTTGGGAVYHDLGNLNYSLITDYNEREHISMNFFINPIVEALKNMDIKAISSERNDILIDGKKISGSAQRLYKNRILHHGCILFDSDLSVLSKSLKVKPEKFQSKSVKSVRNRVANISDFLKEPKNIYDFKNYILDSISRNNEIKNLNLTKKDIENINKLKENKYKTWEWNYGRSPKFNINNSKKFEGGIVEVYLLVENGFIETCSIYGDFMALKPVSDITNKLIKCKYDADDIKDIILQFNIKDYFGNICIDDIVKLISCL